MRYQVRNLFTKDKRRIAAFELQQEASAYAARQYLDNRCSYDVVDSEDTSTVGGRVVFTVGDIFEDEK